MEAQLEAFRRGYRLACQFFAMDGFDKNCEYQMLEELDIFRRQLSAQEPVAQSDHGHGAVKSMGDVLREALPKE